MNERELVLSTVQYYALEGNYSHMRSCLLGLLKRFGSDPQLLFWKGFSLLLEGRLVDSIRELSHLQDTPELLLCVPLLLRHAHENCETVDQEAVTSLVKLMDSTRSSITTKDYYYAGVAMWLLGKYDKAREYIEKVLKASPRDRDALSVKGWIGLTRSKDDLGKKIGEYFDVACSTSDPPPLYGILGKIRFSLLKHKCAAALDIINTYSAHHTDFMPLYLEKIKVQVALADWEGAMETAKRCSMLDSMCVQAAIFFALEQCIHQGDMTKGSELLGDLLVLLDQSEPKADKLYHSIALVFSRIANGHPLLLQQSMTIMERAISINPKCQEYMAELGNQHLMAGNTSKAMKLFRACVAVDKQSTVASIGIGHCLLKAGKVKVAQQQLEFLFEIVNDEESIATLLYLKALVQQKNGAEPDEVVQLLNEAINIHFSIVKGLSLGLKYLILINPYFIMRIAKCMMDYAPSDPYSTINQSSSNLLQCVVRVLAPLTVAVPGLFYIQLVLARIKYLSGDFAAGLSLCQACIDGSYKAIESHILQAIIHLHQGSLTQCSQSLEVALSSSFEVQQCALYHIVKGRQQLASGMWKESHKSLETALAMRNEGKSTGDKLLPDPSVSEWVSAYLSLSEVFTGLRLPLEATRIMNETAEQFAGTVDEARIIMANAELLIAFGDTKEALKVLSKVTEDKSFYIQAKERMADVYLKHEGNQSKYVACYTDLASKLPGPPTFQLLGDAYMNVQEYSSAIAIYEKLVRKKPKDGSLANKIGQACMKAHMYSKTIQFYENSLRAHDVFPVRYALASVYFKLKEFDKAKKIASNGVDNSTDRDISSTEYMREQVEYRLLLAQVFHCKEMPEEKIDNLEIALNSQAQLVKRSSLEMSGTLAGDRKKLIEIVLQLAKHFEQLPDGIGRAERYYHQILEVDENNTKARILLIKLYQSTGDIERCEEECLKLLHKDNSSDDSAALLMAELMMLKGDLEGAAKHMEDILIKKPDDYDCLASLIKVKRRLGDLPSIKYYITQAETCSAQSVYEPKLIFCKGIFNRYMGQSEEALLLLNQIKSNPVCREDALFNMIEICISDEILGMDSLNSSESDNSMASADLMAIKTAEKLLKELNPTTPANALRHSVLENFVSLLSRSRVAAEHVLASIQGYSSFQKESSSVLLLSATAFVILKQSPKARNHLKRLCKMSWKIQNAEDMERGWMLLADMYMQSGKYDLAIDLLKKCLKYNKSCSKASECMGYICEKEHAYQDAAMHYESAWQHSQMTSPAIGYRLAFNYLKARQYMKAIDVCHQVLSKHPSYPKIRKDILNKARQSIRN